MSKLEKIPESEYAEHTIIEISEKYGISKDSVSEYCKLKGYTRRWRSNYFKRGLQELTEEEYKNKSLRYICSKYGYTKKVVNEYALEKGWRKRRRGKFLNLESLTESEYNRVCIEELSERYGCSKTKIIEIGNERGWKPKEVENLKETPKIDFLTEELYANYKITEICEMLGYSYGFVRNYALSKGWNDDWKWCYRWKQDEDILGEDDYSYYFLGYFVGDGSLYEKRSRSYSFQVDSAETEVLEKMMMFLRIKSIKETQRKTYEDRKKYTNNYTIYKNSRPIYEWLVSKGVESNKSNKDCIIKVNEDFYFSYLRGLLDSDGTVHVASGVGGYIEWIGTREIILDICGVLSSYGYNPRTTVTEIRKNKYLYKCTVYDRYGIKELYKNMYNSDMYLTRKKKKIEEILESYGNREIVMKELKFNRFMRPGWVLDE